MSAETCALIFRNYADEDVAVEKLFCRYAYQDQGPDSEWAMASGWLIKDDILVTAGHCAYDRKYNLGPLKQVKVYVGYCGRDNAHNPTVQFRHGTQVVTAIGWLKGKEGGAASDISFIRMQKGFTDITPMRFRDTPETGNLDLGVIGYSSDKVDASTGECGAFMYEDFQNTSFDLRNSKYNNARLPDDNLRGVPILRLNLTGICWSKRQVTQDLQCWKPGN